MDLAKLKHLIEIEGLQQWKAAEALGVSVSCIERNCKKYGLKTHRTGPRSGAGHPEWKGGRRIVGGYMYIYSPEHPHHTKQKAVAEHRLVMEEKLGRYLLPTEVVHHVDGNPLNNHPDNLMVFGCNADHLKFDLKGKIPNWTPEGRARTLGGWKQKRMRQMQEAGGGSQHTQSNDHLTDSDDKEVPQAS